ncbi:FMN-binding protein [Streptococcus plurextorum]|uniref:FMN-binding protein n=1 Tax=Streptococcus plurextorum TaxID=456876 RepID=UPI000422CA33|nr:FMN-binding protein [Streptococcus plurextorum]
MLKIENKRIFRAKKIQAMIIAAIALVAGTISTLLIFLTTNQDVTSSSSALSQETGNETNEASQTVQASIATSDAVNSSTDQTAKKLADGIYTGAITSTRRGDYQVQMSVSGGTITDITVLEYPNKDRESQQINANALPTYTAEALTSQSADINAISGATEAFNGFTGSLQDAINQAQA